MTGILTDFAFTIAYLDDIIIFSRTAEEHLTHIQKVFGEIKASTSLNETQQMSFFHQGNTVPRTHSQHKWH